MSFAAAPARLHLSLQSFALIVAFGWTSFCGNAAAAGIAPNDLEFFERKVRPVLVSECYECHAGEKRKGGLRLDSRDHLLKGGDSGAAVTPGKPEESLLIQSVRHADPDLKMPEKAPKLDDATIADLVEWVRMGAPDPRDHAESASAASARPWADTLAVRRQWWSFQPVQKPELPAVQNEAWSNHPVDRFLLAKMEEADLQPGADASPEVLLRRLHFVLTGLPPQREEVISFTESYAAATPQERTVQIAEMTDRLLASPRFGERWARHWMDLFRYAETHGSEGDPEIPDAWRYRDYLIRAFNADVPWDQLIREHIAGDLLDQPRWNREEQINESKLGVASLRLTEHGFQPVDTFEEQVRTVDNQIDVIAKAFQGLTISCARCHDHKFDPVSQRDYYALFGVLASTRPVQLTIDAPELLARHSLELDVLKTSLRDELTKAWKAAVPQLVSRLKEQHKDGQLLKLIGEAMNDHSHPLYPWANLGSASDETFPQSWALLRRQWRAALEEIRASNRAGGRVVWDFTRGGHANWTRFGSGLWHGPVSVGEFSVEPSGDKILAGLLPAGVATHALSSKHNGHFSSPRFQIDSDRISVRAAGGGGAWVRLILDNYPLNLRGTLPREELKSDKLGWVTMDTAYRRGSWAYLEFATRDDLTRRERSRDPGGRSWFAVERIVFHNAAAPEEEPVALETLFSCEAPQSAGSFAKEYERVLLEAITAWRMDTLNESQRALLDFFLRADLLPRTLATFPQLAGTVAEFRRLEADTPSPRRAPGVIDAEAWDAPFMPRGDHMKPGDPVPRRYLEVLHSANYAPAGSGRLELANEIASSRNPLTARVLVNRVWLHLFGEGLVRTADNFGRLGEKPTHPELLDFIAAHFIENDWSSKELIRFLFASRAWQLTSEPTDPARERDPGNALLAHARVRRLEAEAIRDSLLFVSARLDPAMYGPGATDNSTPRRSVYLAVRRNNLHPFLEAFDAPKPFTTLGRRDSTNVPAQSLALLNDSFVIDLASHWSRGVSKDASADLKERVRSMFTAAFGRKPSEEEVQICKAHLMALAERHHTGPDQILPNAQVWQDFAHSLFNLKEFIYVR